jgi:20S proteasome alpha/beta subunit
MTVIRNRSSLKHLGALHGSGTLSAGKQCFGSVSYEIDGYLERSVRSANGQIEGDVAVLEQAFRAGAARIALEGGSSIEVVLSDPQGGPTAEIKVSGHFPL